MCPVAWLKKLASLRRWVRHAMVGWANMQLLAHAYYSMC